MQEAAVVLRSQVFLRLPHTLEVLLVPGVFETESLQGMRVSLPTNLSIWSNKKQRLFCKSSTSRLRSWSTCGLSNSFKNGTSATLSWTDSPCPLLDSSGYGRANVCFVLQLLEHPLQIVPAKAVQSRNPPLRCLTRHSYCTQQSQHKPSKASKASRASKEPPLPGF